MTDKVQSANLPHGHETVRTPAGLQDARVLTWRRRMVFALNLVTIAALLTALLFVFGEGGWNLTDIVIFVCVMIGAPWTVMGFWNAVIGLWLMHGARDGLRAAAPQMLDVPDAALSTRTVLTMFLRNEPPEASFARLVEMRRTLDETGQGAAFDIAILSDTDDLEIAAEEDALFAQSRMLLGANAVYRRRTDNTGFKTGNLRSWLSAHGRAYDFFLPLDTDSLMSGPAIVRMVRMMESHPNLGILQSLVVGAPARSAFARIFQFGMRHGMRSFTIGAAWWHGDCGPYWGHNALIRTTPFLRHCRLPILPGNGPLDGHIMSHDQVEAVLMRRAGFECRVMPVEGESWEENPPTLLDFTKRDLRWCQGNMQYFRILGWKGLQPMSRFQLFAAVMMYFGAPAWMLMTGAAAFKLMEGDFQQVNLAFGLSMFFIMVAMSLFPKIAGWIDVMLRPGGIKTYGGGWRFAAGALIETLFSILLAPVVAFRVTLFLIGLLFGKSVIWGAQNRDPYALPLGTAIRGLWPQTLAGTILAGLLLSMAPAALVWALPVLAGLIFSIPLALITAFPALGRLLAKRGICAVPDEVTEHPVLKGATLPIPLPTEARPAA
ncbi:glucans biosynthesis glucosyltransferase MdoH [Pontivivens insulae]|uniref:Glucans biosynthesis glucosyltransferase H n=1 Tax=Pontivivens insulae TaxID=1639689 RepID=A0A2R8AFJ2_9RHOB|nr:glucans biosynthesis glucosyltransferase MdoH [Pontivivens insulae]RED12112.1 membrane glycosyltransferase [Pontivivens insulae]SPF30868.1 Glucans biosynthesis glucosyltransferase H [Pontivivens insulae]